MDPDILQLLARLPHFGGIDIVTLGRIAEGCRVAELQRDAWLFRQGEAPRAFFHVLEGGVRLFRMTPDGREQVIHRLRADQSFAEAAVLNMRAYPVHAVAAETPTRLLEVGREPFLKIFDTNKRLARAMVASLSGRLVRLVRRIDELSVASVEARLARYLLDLPGTESDLGLVVRLPAPKKDVAAYLATTPESISRHLRRWRENGIAITRGAEIEITKVEHLLGLAAD